MDNGRDRGATACPDDPVQDEQQLIQHADTALYRAKQEGRSRVVQAEC